MTSSMFAAFFVIFFVIHCAPWANATEYSCSYETYVNFTINGANLPNSGAGSISGEDCASQCCQMANCYGSVWISSQYTCYFADNKTVATQQKTVSPGLEYWIISSKAACSQCANSYGDCKRGIAYDFTNVSDLIAVRKGATWWYNWSPTPNSYIAEGTVNVGSEFVPMMWNGDYDIDTLVAQIPEDAKYLLGFNEPNFFSQANLSATQAAQLWPNVTEVARRRTLKIVGPAVNYCGPPSECHDTDPYAYLDAFFAACTNCQVDYIAAHLYSCSGASLAQYLDGFRKYGKPIWLTEFACSSFSSMDQQNTYMTEALAILDSDPYVFRYAWFSGRTTNVAYADLLANTGATTELGNTYTSQNLVGSCSANQGSGSSSGDRIISFVLVQWCCMILLWITIH